MRNHILIIKERTIPKNRLETMSGDMYLDLKRKIAPDTKPTVQKNESLIWSKMNNIEILYVLILISVTSKHLS